MSASLVAVSESADPGKGEGRGPAPFLKWPGGKRWLVASHAELLKRRRCERYIEPFLGAGSVYFYLRPGIAMLGDLNADLITAFRGIQSNHEGVQLLLEKHHLAHCAEHYYQVRDTIPATLIGRAARVIYLNRTCFNGIYRVNRLGQFNVPLGSRTQVVRATDDYAAIAGLLSGADLSDPIPRIAR